MKLLWRKPILHKLWKMKVLAHWHKRRKPTVHARCQDAELPLPRVKEAELGPDVRMPAEGTDVQARNSAADPVLTGLEKSQDAVSPQPGAAAAGPFPVIRELGEAKPEPEAPARMETVEVPALERSSQSLSEEPARTAAATTDSLRWIDGKSAADSDRRPSVSGNEPPPGGLGAASSGPRELKAVREGFQPYVPPHKHTAPTTTTDSRRPPPPLPPKAQAPWPQATVNGGCEMPPPGMWRPWIPPMHDPYSVPPRPNMRNLPAAFRRFPNMVWRPPAEPPPPPSPPPQPPPVAPPVAPSKIYVLDALNIMHYRNDGQQSSGDLCWDYLQQTAQHYQKRGHTVRLFFPRLSNVHDKHVNDLKDILGSQCIVTTPSGADDDRFMLSYAKLMKEEGEHVLIVTNDLLRNFISSKTLSPLEAAALTVKFCFAAGRFVPEALDK